MGRKKVLHTVKTQGHKVLDLAAEMAQLVRKFEGLHSVPSTHIKVKDGGW